MTIYRDQLEAVYKLIEKPESWTQNAYARDACGEFLLEDSEGDDLRDARHPRAVCWCLLGAGYKCGIEERHMNSALAMEHVNAFNDSHTHAEVLALLTSAIERAPVRSKGQS